MREMMRATGFCVAVLLTSCATPPPIPVALACPAPNASDLDPVPMPQLRGETEADAALLVADLALALRQCNAQLAGVRAWAEDAPTVP